MSERECEQNTENESSDAPRRGDGMRALSCIKCGAPLNFDVNDPTISCKYCGQTHQPDFPSNPGNSNKFFANEHAVLVEWDSRWWKARVLETVEPERWLIH